MCCTVRGLFRALCLRAASLHAVWSFVLVLSGASAHALELVVPTPVVNGAVIPVSIRPSGPVTAMQRIELEVNGELAAQARVIQGSLSAFQTRIRATRASTVVVARVVGSGGVLDSASITLEVRTPAPRPDQPTLAKQIVGKAANGEASYLVRSESGLSGVMSVRDGGFFVEVRGSTLLSSNPVFKLNGTFSDQVTATIDGLTSERLTQRDDPRTPPAGQPPAAQPGGTQPPAPGQIADVTRPAAPDAQSPGGPGVRETPAVAGIQPPPQARPSAQRPAAGWPTLSAADLGPCRAQISQFHKLELAYIRRSQNECRDQECRKDAAQWLAESARQEDIAWFVKGNSSCGASDYPCFGLQVFNEPRSGPEREQWIEQFRGMASQPPAQAGNLEDYSFVVDACVAKVWVAKLDGGSATGGKAEARTKPTPIQPASPGKAAQMPANGQGALQPQQKCLSLGTARTGAISTESSSLRNSCKVAVGYTFCVDSPNGGGVFSCKGQKFGAGSVKPGGSDGISIMGADQPFTVHWYECQAGPKRSYPIAVYGKFVGGRVEAECR